MTSLETIDEQPEVLDTIQQQKKEDIDIQYAFNNCQLLFDPDQTQDREKLCELIDSDIRPRAILFFFVTNTCNIVQGLTEATLTTVINWLKALTDEDAEKWANFIFQCFITPVDILKTGQLYAIWGLFFVACGLSTELAKTSSTETTGTQSQTLLETANTEIIAEQETLEPKIAE